MRVNRKVLVCILFVVFVLSCVSRVSAEVTESQARVVLDNVYGFLGRAFVAVADAEAAGANVSSLKMKLAQGGILLANANATFSLGNYTGAESLAMQANASIQGMDAEAMALAASARENWSARLDWAILVSSVGVSLAVFFVLVGWVYFRRYYVGRVLGLKPEVRKQE